MSWRHDSVALHAKVADGDEGRAKRAACAGREPSGGLVAESVAHAPEAGGGDQREHDRLGLVLEAAPYATLPQRFVEAVFVQLLAIGVPPDAARCV